MKANSMTREKILSFGTGLPCPQKAAVKFQFRKKILAASLLAIGSGTVFPVLAQSDSGALKLEEIVVSARRRDESLQDVPLTVNAVTTEQLNELNIRTFEDLEGVVAGLTLDEDTIAPTSSIRGVQYDTFSGGTPSVEFYLNDAPMSPNTVMQAMFDVGQIEVLRGPQGTLRGRSSPSGSITVTTQKPVMNEFGGFIDTTATDLSGKNVSGAVNIPIIDDTLAMRVAGVFEDNTAGNTKNVFSGDRNERQSDGYRFSLAYQPIDELAIDLMHQSITVDRVLYQQVESANIMDPTLPAPGMPIKASDRRSVQDAPLSAVSDLESSVLNIAWDIGNHQINMGTSHIEEGVDRPLNPDDPTNAVNANAPAAWQGPVGQSMVNNSERNSFELRLESTEPLFNDKIDYVVGGLYIDTTSPTDLTQDTLLQITYPSNLIGIPGPVFNVPVAHLINVTEIAVRNTSEEVSFFGNLTYHLTDNTEATLGARRIELENTNKLTVGENQLLDQVSDFSDTVMSTSIKHSFSDDLMVYFVYGESFRRGLDVVGDFSLVQSSTQEKFTTLAPETSESFEIGMKSSWLENRLRLNLTAFHQEFENYPFRPSQEIFYAKYDFGGFGPDGIILNPVVGQHNFVAAVPVTVDGVEMEAFLAATESLDLGVLFSYAKGEVDNGVFPCNDYLPNDGLPDSSSQRPTLDDIFAAAGDENLTECSGSFRSNAAPLWTSTLTAEYSFVIGDMDAYVRGLWALFGESDNDVNNPIDDVDSYNILSLYAGVRDLEDKWSVMIFAKNVLDTDEVLDRGRIPGNQSYIIIDGVSQQPYGEGTLQSDYRTVSVTQPREIGVNFRYNF